MPNMHDVFMKTALLFSGKSKCVSYHVGVVIVKNNRIIVTGYNGSPPGTLNCNEVFTCGCFDRDSHHVWSKDNEVHAEMNAIAFAAKNEVDINGSDMYVTVSPCNDCLKNITMTGIKNVYYLYPYDKSVLNPALTKIVNVAEIPGATELREWAEKNGLFPKQQNKCL